LRGVNSSRILFGSTLAKTQYLKRGGLAVRGHATHCPRLHPNCAQHIPIHLHDFNGVCRHAEFSIVKISLLSSSFSKKSSGFAHCPSLVFCKICLFDRNWTIFYNPISKYMKNGYNILAVQDIFLDTPLVNAHTSATDILWAGGEVKLSALHLFASPGCQCVCDCTSSTVSQLMCAEENLNLTCCLSKLPCL
jgi:hypothetical protein